MAKIKDGNFITNKDDVEYLLSLKEKDITMSLIIELFGKFNGKRRFNPFDYLRVPPNTYGPEGNKNKNECVTTAGLWLFNRLFIEQELFHVFKYVNHEINGDDFEQMCNILSYELLEDGITLPPFKHFLLKSQICMSLASVLSAHYTDELLTLSDKLAPLKKKLIEENKEALANGDEVVSEMIEKQLIDKAKELLKDDECMEIFNSKARGNINNNLKNMCMMKGAVMNHVTGKYDIATSNFMDGITKEEYHIFANSIAPGATARAVKTQVGGYWEKLLLSAFQHVKIDKPGSDCGTKRYITVSLNSKNIADWMYSFVIKGDKLIEITSKTKDQFIGQTVKIRYSALCESKGDLCEHCCGTLYRRLGIVNAGMSMPKLGSTLKQRSLKGFHDSTVKTTEIDLMAAFSMPKKKIG